MTKPKGPGKPNKSWCWAERAEEKKMKPEQYISLVTGVLEGTYGAGAMACIINGSIEGKSIEEITSDLEKIKNEE